MCLNDATDTACYSCSKPSVIFTNQHLLRSDFYLLALSVFGSSYKIAVHSDITDMLQLVFQEGKRTGTLAMAGHLSGVVIGRRQSH